MVLMGCTSGKFSEYFLFMVLFTDLNFITNGLSSGFEVVSFVGEGAAGGVGADGTADSSFSLPFDSFVN